MPVLRQATSLIYYRSIELESIVKLREAHRGSAYYESSA